MKYSIHITQAAERDMVSSADHIEFVLLNPQAADDLLAETQARIEELSAFPEKYALVDDPVLKAWGLRFVAVKKHIVFYTVSEEEHRVYILRFLYHRRNWTDILRQGGPSAQ